MNSSFIIHHSSFSSVGARGFEPPTPWSRTRCSTRLSHAPKNLHTKRPDTSSQMQAPYNLSIGPLVLEKFPVISSMITGRRHRQLHSRTESAPESGPRNPIATLESIARWVRLRRFTLLYPHDRYRNYPLPVRARTLGVPAPSLEV